MENGKVIIRASHSALSGAGTFVKSGVGKSPGLNNGWEGGVSIGRLLAAEQHCVVIQTRAESQQEAPGGHSIAGPETCYSDIRCGVCREGDGWLQTPPTSSLLSRRPSLQQKIPSPFFKKGFSFSRLGRHVCLTNIVLKTSCKKPNTGRASSWILFHFSGKGFVVVFFFRQDLKIPLLPLKRQSNSTMLVRMKC